jgi:transposase
MTELRRDPLGMLTEEDDVEIHALGARGWSVSAISRHTGRDRKTVRRYLRASPRSARAVAPSCLEPFRGYIAARFDEDRHLEATVLHRELVEAGFERASTTPCFTANARAQGGLSMDTQFPLMPFAVPR